VFASQSTKKAIIPMMINVSSTKAGNGKNRFAIFTISRNLRRANGVIELMYDWLSYNRRS